MSRCLITIAIALGLPAACLAAPHPTIFPIQSIDTVKDSRDLAREAENDPSYDTNVIAKDISLIAETGATHVAIDTPYDPEFLPVMRRWVTAARAQGLSVWFRGNFSGWEDWFGYSAISRSQHIEMIQRFIADDPDLFRDGDLFMACPECENGGPGDPRMNGDLAGHRQFLIQEYAATKAAFASIGKDVDSAPTSMNADVAKLVMDKDTAGALGGVVTIDDYTRTSGQLMDDIQILHEKTGAKVIVGEFGAPIPDLNGSFSEAQQSDFVEGILAGLYYDADIVGGVNYWVISGGSTALVTPDGTPKQAYKTLELYYSPKSVSGVIRNDLGTPVANARFLASQVPSDTIGYSLTTDNQGRYTLLFPHAGAQIFVTDPRGAYDRYSFMPQIGPTASSSEDIILVPAHPGLFYGFLKFLRSLL